MKFSDLVDIDALRELFENYSAINNTVIAILDLDGNILIATGWKDICTRFHRSHEGTAVRCRESDTILAGGLKDGESYHLYKCKNGLVDAAVPIVIHGEHLANFFTGQFLTEHPDREFFLRQADEFGFEKGSYLEALMQVPILSEETVKSMMDFFVSLVRLIVDMGLVRKEMLEVNQRLQKSEERLLLALQASSSGTWDWDINNDELTWDDSMYALYGINKASFGGAYSAWIHTIHPDDRSYVEGEIQSARRGEHDYHPEFRIIRPDGDVRYIKAASKIIYDENGKALRMVGTNIDISERKKIEEELKGYREHLEELVKSRTAELEEKNTDLENLNRCFVDRELRMIELKERIRELEKSESEGDRHH